MLPPIMAVSGPPNQEGASLDFSVSSEPQYSPILEGHCSPDSGSPSPGPVSPGKKRVRISDSTSVRLIDDDSHHAKHKAKDKQNNNNSLRTSRIPRFNSESDGSDREALLGAGQYDGEYQEEEYQEEYSRSGEEYTEYTELLCTVDHLTFPEDAPLRPSESLESRDNPFLPGGDLSKEAEELLSKATIVRDKFYLDQERQKLLKEPEQIEGAHADPITEPSHDVVDGILPNATNSPAIVEERICPTSATPAEVMPEPQPRENGKAGEGVTSDTSPDKVRLEVGGSPTADGSKGVSNDTDAEQQDKDKAKRRPKCCLLM